MNTDVYNIAKKTFNGATQKPIYKLDGGVVYILYFPDAYGWRITDIEDDGDLGDFYHESKNIIIETSKCFDNLNYFIKYFCYLHKSMFF